MPNTRIDTGPPQGLALCLSWLMKMIVTLHLEALPEIFLSACPSRRACAPTAQQKASLFEVSQISNVHLKT